MEWHEPIGQAFPPPNEAEPSSLRRDIEDELSDHLGCSLVREMGRVKDEKTAQRIVLDRFGDPRKLARRLWWGSMKGTVVMQKVNLVATIALAIGCVALLGFSLANYQQNQQLSQTLIEQSGKLNEVVDKLVDIESQGGRLRDLGKDLSPEAPLKLFESINIQVEHTIPIDPKDSEATKQYKTINGAYKIQRDGSVNLGPIYGSVEVAGGDIYMAKEKIEKHLGKFLYKYGVSVTRDE